MIGCILLILGLYWFFTKRLFRSLLIYFLFLTNGLQFIPISFLMAGLPLDKGSDLAIIYVILITLLNLKKIKSILLINKLFKWILYLLGFLLLDALYSLFILNYSFINVIQVFRPYLIYLSFVFFFVIPLKVLKKGFNFLAYITILQSILFLIQIISGKTILFSGEGNENITTTLLENGNYTRYYNTPVFLIPTLFYFLFAYTFKSNIFKYGILSILILAVIGPMHRSYILVLIAVLSIYTFTQQKKQKQLIYLSIVGLGLYFSTYIQVVSDRIDSAFVDLKTTFSSNLSLTTIDITENNMIFRVGHFLERFNYILLKPLGWLFGIGLISDNSVEASKLPFQFGLISEVTGNVIQIDTGDIIWSPLFLTLGIVGTLIYTILYLIMLNYFYKNMKFSNFAVIGFLTVLFSFMISFTSTEMISTTFRAISLMLVLLSYKEEQKLSEQNDRF